LNSIGFWGHVFKYVLLIIPALAFSSGCASQTWYTYRSGYLEIKAASKDTAYVNYIIGHVQNRIGDVQMQLGIYPKQLLRLVILPDRASYQAVTTGKGKTVEQSEAFYSAADKLIYLRSPDQLPSEAYGKVILHEYIHWFLDQTFRHVPLWFNEGMAMYYSGEFGFVSYVEFSKLRFLGYRMHLDDMLERYPGSPADLQIFYLTSMFALHNLVSEYPDQWQVFWNQASAEIYHNTRQSQKADFIRCFNTAFGYSLYAYSTLFDKAVSRYNWQFPLVGINALILCVLPFIVILGWRRYRKRLRALPDIGEEEFMSDDDDSLQADENPEPHNGIYPIDPIDHEQH